MLIKLKERRGKKNKRKISIIHEYYLRLCSRMATNKLINPRF